MSATHAEPLAPPRPAGVAERTRHRIVMLLAEFDYDRKPAQSIPLIDAQKERYDMCFRTRYACPSCAGTACCGASPDRMLRSR